MGEGGVEKILKINGQVKHNKVEGSDLKMIGGGGNSF